MIHFFSIGWVWEGIEFMRPRRYSGRGPMTTTGTSALGSIEAFQLAGSEQTVSTITTVMRPWTHCSRPLTERAFAPAVFRELPMAKVPSENYDRIVAALFRTEDRLLHGPG